MRSIIILMCLVISINANAALISIGSFDIDEFKFADLASVASGTLSSAPNDDPDSIVGFNFDSYASLGTTTSISFSFIDNTLFNGRGLDLLIFELAGPEAPKLFLTSGGGEVSGVLLETATSVVGARYDVNIFGFDLSDLGMSGNSIYTGSLFVGAPERTPDIAAIAAINSYAVNVNAPPSLALFGVMLLLAGQWPRIHAKRLSTRSKV